MIKVYIVRFRNILHFLQTFTNTPIQISFPLNYRKKVLQSFLETTPSITMGEY